jgi:hypothetical protein
VDEDEAVSASRAISTTPSTDSSSNPVVAFSPLFPFASMPRNSEALGVTKTRTKCAATLTEANQPHVARCQDTLAESEES